MGSSTLFVGNSSYSQDFSQVIERSLAIAQLPILQVEQQKLQLVDRNSAITSLQGKFESLRIALKDLSDAVGGSNLEANFSSTGIASASLGGGPIAGQWTLEVLSLGSRTNYVTASGVSDPELEGFGTELTKTLVVDGVEREITLNANSLDALAEAINAAGAGVNATIVNVSGTSMPSYKLVLEGDKLGSQAIALKDGAAAAGMDLLETTALVAGTNAEYKVNGIAINAESLTVTVAPDVEISLTGLTAESGPVSFAVKRNGNRIIESLRTVVSTFNSASSALDEHRGKGAGVLKGQSTIGSLAEVLRHLTRYTTDTGTFQSFVDLGLRFDDQGLLTLDSGVLAGLSDEKLDALVGYLGIAEESGFVASALETLAAATEEESGILATEKESYTNQIKSDDNQVLQMRERLSLMESDLRERFAIMDSLIASLQQQALYINNLFESMRIATQTYSR